MENQQGTIEGGDTNYETFEPLTLDTCSDHTYGHPSEVGGLIEVSCINPGCIHGCAFDPDEMKLEDGKLVKNV